MPAKHWPQPINQNLGQTARQAGLFRASALTAVAALALGLQIAPSNPLLGRSAALPLTGLPVAAQGMSKAGANKSSGDDAEVAVSQSLKVDPSQYGCAETDAPGIPAGCGIVGTLEVSNLGPDEARDIVVTDELPSGLLEPRVITPQSKCSVSGGLLICKLDPIEVGGSATIMFTGKTSTTASDRLVNVARAEAAGIDPNPADNVGMTSRSLNASSDLAVSQTSTISAVEPGGEVRLQVSVTNYGPSDASNVRLLASSADPLQAMFSEIDVNAPDGSTANCDAMPDDVNAVRCVVDELKVGDTMTATVTGRLRADLPTAGMPVDFDINVAADTFDVNPDNNSDRTTVTSVAPAADLNIGVEDPDPLHLGEQAVWTWTVQNAGPSNATDSKVTVTLPANLANIEVTSDHGNCTLVSQTVAECDLGMMYASEDPMDPGNTAEVAVRATPTSTDGFTISATVSGDQADPDPDNTAASTMAAEVHTGATEDEPQADVVISNFRITPLDSSYTGPGSQRRIQFTVTNNGPDVAETTWFRLTRTVDATANLTGDLANNCMATSRELMCAVRADSDLQPGESVNIDYTIDLGSIARIGDYTDYVHAYSQTADPDETNNYAQADIEIDDSATELALAMTPIGTVRNEGSPGDPASLTNPDGDPSFVAGGNFTYRVAASVPAGYANASNVAVKINLPTGFVPVSAVSGSGHCTFTAGDQPTADCLLPTVNAGTTTIINVSGNLKKQANDLYPNGDNWAEGVLADVTATSATPDRSGAEASASASTLVDIIESADLSVLVTPDEPGTHESGTAGYTVSVLNQGPSGVEHTAITTMLPMGVVLDESSDCDPVPDLDVTGTGTLDVVPLAPNYLVGAPNAVLCAAAPNTKGTAEELNAGQMGSVHLVVRGTPDALAKGFNVTAGSLAFDPNHENNVATAASEEVLPDTGLQRPMQPLQFPSWVMPSPAGR